ncbi:hypothetical protein HPDFL43_16411 [Hoeflea phototrophica DFL-43]|jgi:hypothetical protein|uniref:Uncharacterized protein n=1 Tax=Hoeflea phototrophica (strain DSM 17068 / NCIMB 14078 / DFL-43) TaxID=411684 RepID=A9D7H0_HOEPD|nr:hypothetical protein [Hoeflea phototrophica]EDQ33076.2 hypothetical protein HPDFL43_16411 [Hoeflea phototrophica DFL-43]
MRNRVLILALMAATAAGESTSAKASDEVQHWVCTAIGENIGKTEPGYMSDIMRWPDDRFRTIEPGAEYYTSDNPDEADWLEVYAVPNGHGSTLIGFLQPQNFNCSIYQVAREFP